MPRALRHEFPGGIYHLINRGNYRKDLFAVAKSGEAFEKALFEVSERCGWAIHAYVLMSNHFHLAVETPKPNLVDGMTWLQGTFATRFNRFTKERGHVFQGRYKSLIVEPGSHLLSLVDYIHLNPVRAKICKLDELEQYPLSSFPKFFERKRRSCLERGLFLSEMGLPDTLAGMRRYADELALKEEADPKKRAALHEKYCRGWLLGDSPFKKEIVDEMKKMPLRRSWHGEDLKALKGTEWEAVIKKQLKSLRKSEQSIKSDKKAADWKVSIARHMRNHTTASNPWIAERLNMGHPSRVSNLIHQR